MIYLKGKALFLMSFLFFGACSTGEKYNSEVAVKEFYERAKEREKDLDVLFNVSFTARGLNDDKTFYIHHFTYEFSESKSIVLPVVEERRSKQDIIESDDYKNVKEYASMQGITESQVFDYTSKIKSLVNQLKVGKVFSSPRVGKFIVFSLTDMDEVIYVPDTSKVNSPYWKKVFSTGKQLDKKWYYKRTGKAEAD
jgi:hypothetical protein